MPDFNTDAIIKFVMGELPPGYCLTSVQQLANDIAANLTGYLPGPYSTIVKSNTKPNAIDPAATDVLWFRLEGDGSPDGMYVWGPVGATMKWIRRHVLNNDPLKSQIWTGSAAAVDTIDGGTAGPVTDDSGPFWAITGEMAGKFPVGVGALDDDTTLAVGDTGGFTESNHTILPGQLPPHIHEIGIGQGQQSDLIREDNRTGCFKVDALIKWESDTESKKYGLTLSNHEEDADEPHEPIAVPTVPPYRAVYFIHRTARIYYSIP